MVVFNITFSIDKPQAEILRDYLRSEYVPAAIESNLVSSPRLHLVLPREEDEIPSFALQFEIVDLSTLRQFQESPLFASMNEQLAKQFGSSMTGFTSILEVLDL